MTGFPRIEPLGESALLVRFGDRLDDAVNRAALAFRADLERRPVGGVAETAPSLGSVLVRLAGDAAAVEGALLDRLAAWAWGEAPLPPRRRWRIPCHYGGADGPDLAEVAAMAGLTEAAAVVALGAAPVRVLALGFAPGMPYLGILPPRWDLPRRTDLAPRVPEGALVIAVRQLVLFGAAAPTGWRHVGRTAFGCFRPGRARPVALAPGDEVTFPAVGADALEAAAAADRDGHGGATWEAVA